MAKFESRYKSLGFYVNSEYCEFRDGYYVTEDAATIAVLSTLVFDVARVDEPEVTTKEMKPEPEVKAPTSRKTSTK